MRGIKVLAIGAVVLQVQAERSVVLESTQSLPPGWNFRERAQGPETIQLSIALKQHRIDDLKTRLLRSGSGEHLTIAELRAYREPQPKAVEKVQQWLSDHGIKDARAAESWISFSTTPAGIKELFQANVAYYAYDEDDPVLRTRSYTIPSSLSDYIDFVFPLAHFMPPSHARPQPKLSRLIPRQNNVSDSTCADIELTPACLRQLYKWDYAGVAAPSPSRFGIAGFLNEYINYDDVAAFMSTHAPAYANLTPPYNFTVQLVNNGTNPQSPRWRAGMEASLDVEWAMALAYPTDITYFSTGGKGSKLDPAGQPLPPTESDNEPYLEFLEHLLALPAASLPHTLSISYADDEQSVPAAYARRVCDLFLQLTSRGVSVLAATGDGGAAGIGRNLCVTNDGRSARRLLSTFPASCPWVTAVGATSNRPITDGAEFSTGGFSELFEMPEWQRAAVTPYAAAAEAGSKRGLFNVSGRAIPDISAVGANFRVVWGEMPSLLSGTSASAPVVASMVALANDARMRVGKQSIGWLNPVLYAANFTSVVEDITSGESRDCRFNRSGDREVGWPAAPGWDAITGLGVPRDLKKFVDALATWS
jgi:tripeptidyl-peptidase I